MKEGIIRRFREEKLTEKHLRNKIIYDNIFLQARLNLGYGYGTDLRYFGEIRNRKGKLLNTQEVIDLFREIERLSGVPVDK